MVVLVVTRYGEPVYLLDARRLAIAASAGVVALAGLIGLSAVRRYDLALLAGLTAGLLIAGVAAWLSIGILLILLAVVSGWMLARRLRRGVEGGALLSGTGTAAGLLVLTWITLQPPLVACNTDQGATITIDGRFNSFSAEAHRDDEIERGWVSFNGHGFEFECRHGELVRFELYPESD